MTDWLSLLAKQRRQEAEQLRAQQQEALMGMTQEPQLDMGQKLVTGLGALAPLIAGIIRGGKTGLQTGAALGMGVLQDMDRRRRDDMKFDTAIAKTKYDSATKSAEKAESQADKAEFEEAKLADREAKGDLAKHGAAQINLPANEQKVRMPASTADSIAEASASIGGMKAALFELENELRVNPELQKKYKREDGSYDTTSALSILGQSAEAAMIGTDAGARARAEAAWQKVANDIIRATSGLASTGQEAARIQKELGRGIGPKSVPVMIEDLQRIIKKAEFITTQRLAVNDLILRYREGGQHMSSLTQFFEEQTKEASRLFGSKEAGIVAKDISSVFEKKSDEAPGLGLGSEIYGDIKGLFKGGGANAGASAADAARARLRKTYVGQ